MAKTRETPTARDTSIVDGNLYFEDVRQLAVDHPDFADLLDDKYLTSIRLISLASNWNQSVWVGNQLVRENLNFEMTLRAEMRHGRKHWYAYRRVFGKLHKRYIGQSDKIDTQRLVAIAQAMPSK